MIDSYQIITIVAFHMQNGSKYKCFFIYFYNNIKFLGHEENNDKHIFVLLNNLDIAKSPWNRKGCRAVFYSVQGLKNKSRQVIYITQQQNYICSKLVKITIHL